MIRVSTGITVHTNIKILFTQYFSIFGHISWYIGLVVYQYNPINTCFVLLVTLTQWTGCDCHCWPNCHCTLGLSKCVWHPLQTKHLRFISKFRLILHLIFSVSFPSFLFCFLHAFIIWPLQPENIVLTLQVKCVQPWQEPNLTRISPSWRLTLTKPSPSFILKFHTRPNSLD